MKVRTLDVLAGYQELREEFDDAYRRVMESGSYILGAEVEAFEAEFAEVCGTDHVVGVGNGLDALEIALKAHGIGPGDEVITPAHTYIAVWLAIARAGADIVPVDVPEGTLLMDDPDAVAAAFSARTAALLPVHLYGRPVEMAALRELADAHQLVIIEDASQAHGAQLDGEPVGSLGHAAGFSFYPSKNLGAFGDGGAIATKDPDVARRARSLRNYGSTERYVNDDVGANSRLDALQAAFLRVKLPLLERWNARRAQIAATYLASLANLDGLTLPAPPRAGTQHAWHLFCIRHPQRDRIRESLAQAGISTQIHYPNPPHLSGAFEPLGFVRGAFPVAERAAETLLSLPIGPHMDDAQVEAVISAVTQATKNAHG